MKRMVAAMANPLYFTFFLFLSLMQGATFASQKQSYIVYMGAHSHGADVSSADLDRVTESHYELLGSFLGRNKAKDAIFYSYTRSINGFAATLYDEEAAEIAKHPDVVSVFLNKPKKLHTTRSWNFMRLEDNGVIHSSSIWKKARYGEDTIIGNLDTGVWPESKSFSDEGLGPIPSKWKGICQNDGHKKFPCNRKLIGAQYFYNGYASVTGTLDPKNYTPRDIDGHGTHTLSTAGGSFVPGANVLGYGNGTAKGGSPKARVAAYKVCWPTMQGTDCFEADILAGFDAAIHDGVDVLSASLGGQALSSFLDSIAIGSFHAVKNGISVVVSAGNSGPGDGTISNLSPWLLTVGASTMDRKFTNYVTLGNKMQFKGQSLSTDALPNKSFPLISSEDAQAPNTDRDAYCLSESLDPSKVKGKIIVCLRGLNNRANKGQVALSAGAVAMILANDMEQDSDITADPHVLPASHITYADGEAVYNYSRTTKSPVAYISHPTIQLGVKPAPVVASFSSQGPSFLLPEILKPDITAPGVDIIAAYTGAISPTGEILDKRRVHFNIMSGTSMSCPHVSGVVGLLKTLYPKWSPAAIKSAIMTTARTRDNNKQPMTSSTGEKATPFSYGAGHLRPNRAMDPGLVYDLTVKDYMDFLCGVRVYGDELKQLWGGPYTCPKHTNVANFNYPSITVPALDGSIIVLRTLKNVGSPATYRARVVAPPGISASVQPNVLKFVNVGEEKSFNLTLKLIHKNKNVEYVFGRLIWSDGKHYVRSPISVKAV